MQTRLTTSPIDVFVAKLRNSKHYSEFRMTRKGFTNGSGHYYDPSDLTMVNIYSFPNAVYAEELSFVYILRDKNRMLGFSVNNFCDFEANEKNLYNWYITKINRDAGIVEL
jgi:hypothetical protein